MGANASVQTVTFLLQNETQSDTVYAYITGLASDNNNALFLLQADGKTAYYPASPANTMTPLTVDCAIPLGHSGNIISVSVPHLAGARLWFSRDKKLTFYVNPGPALVEPSVSNKSDPNYNIYWDFCEFTYNNSQLYANISYVDFVCLPISLTLISQTGGYQLVRGLPANGLDTICAGLRAQHSKDGAGWDQLIVSENGANLRALSPNTGIVMNNNLFSGYYQPYVNEVWSKYTTAPLTVDTQMASGSKTAQVVNGQLDFAGVASYAQPSAADIFSCSSGPFAATGNITKDAITARLAAAFNRSTLLIDVVQPDNEQVSQYYQNPITNHYARICHAASPDGRGYAFPYDDVAPSNGQDQSGSVFVGNPLLLSVVVGGGGSPVSTVAAAQAAVKGMNTTMKMETSKPTSIANQKPLQLKQAAKSLLRRLSQKK